MPRLIMTIVAITTASVLVTGVAQAQVATALVREGQQLPGAPDGHLVDSINTAAVNHAGGYAFTINTSGDGSTLSRVWGDPAGGEGLVLRTETTIDVLQQNSFESFFGFSNDGYVAYSASCDNLDSGSEGLDSVWLDDTWICLEEEPYPHQAGWWWRFGSRPGVTADGSPYFVGGITDIQGGSTQNRGLFFGLTGTPLLIGGDILDGVDDPVSASSISFDFRLSALGTHYIGEVSTVSPASNDAHMVIDGAVIQVDGQNVTEGMSVPTIAGGLPGEVWQNFDYTGVTEDGRYMFTGDTDAASNVNEFVLVDGAILHREGDTIDGFVVTGSIERAYFNEDGDYAMVWQVVADAGDREALFFNDRLMLMEGDAVDTDGDGIAEPEAVITDFTGIAALAISDRGADDVVHMVFTADVEVTDGRLPVGGGDEIVAAPAMGEESGYDEATSAPRAGQRTEVEMGFIMPTATGTVGIGDAQQMPESAVQLRGAYPNPFNPRTNILFTLARGQRVQLAIFDLTGRRVAVVASGDFAAGEHTATWNGKDLTGRDAAAGTYLIRLTAEAGERSDKMVLVR